MHVLYIIKIKKIIDNSSQDKYLCSLLSDMITMGYNPKSLSRI